MSSVKEVTTLPQVARGQRTNHGVSTPVTVDVRVMLDPARGTGSRSSIGRPRRAETVFAASLSMGAAAIHLAAASSHVEPLGDLALGFYWAALFQVTFAFALLARPSWRPLAQAGVCINIALIGAWAWSRTFGLPMIPGGPEPIAIADATTVVFQIGLVWLLATRLGVLRTGRVRGRSAARPGLFASSASIVGIGLVLLLAPIAMADGLTGHGHASGGRAHPEGDPRLTQPALIETQHGHGGATGH